MLKKLILLMGFFSCFFSLKMVADVGQAVTYELSHGRFGDNLVSYIHAKWIAYKYHLPLLYKPFIYSDRLLLHERELKSTENVEKSFNKIVILGGKAAVDFGRTGTVLYVAPYFPESKYELLHGISFTGKKWLSFDVDWSDKGFIDELKTTIAPRAFVNVSQMNLPKERISVALHMRRGGNHDTPETLLVFPLKFLSDDFYISQVKNLYNMLNEHPLYVYLFTDDNNPAEIVTKFKNCLSGLDIQFDCRKQGNSDTTNVIEDFFTLQQFDCLIHSESNFSFVMGKIAGYLVSIYPDSFCKKNKQIIYDHINITIDSKHEKFTKFTFVKPKDPACYYKFLVKN